MSLKEIKEASEKGKLLIGVKECIKNKKKVKNVFIAKDTRDETVEQLEKAGIEFTVLKTKIDMARELNMNFTSEVFSII